MENKGVIDTKPIESVQAALSLFGEKTDQRKCKSPRSSNEDEKEKELEVVVKELANYKIQLEAKEAAYIQALIKLDYYHNTVDEFSLLLRDMETDRNNHIDQCKEAEIRINELESNLTEMTGQCLETAKLRDELSRVSDELKAKQEEMLRLEKELAATKASEVRALTKAEEMEIVSNMEKEKMEELVKCISNLEDDILISTSAAVDGEKEKVAMLLEKDAEMRKLMETVQDLDTQLLAKTLNIYILEIELMQASGQVRLSEKTASDAVNNLKQMQEDCEVKERESMDKGFYTEALEMELSQLKAELSIVSDEVGRLKEGIETITSELQKAKLELGESRERENEAQVEIALLKSDSLRKGTDEEIKEDSDAHVTISVKEYKSLIEKAETLNSNANESENKDEMENVKKELEAAMVKVGELRTRAEQAVTRAEMAEKAKVAIEDQLRKWREQKQRKKNAQAALQEVSAAKELDHPAFYRNPTNCPPLYKLLDMKF